MLCPASTPCRCSGAITFQRLADNARLRLLNALCTGAVSSEPKALGSDWLRGNHGPPLLMRWSSWYYSTQNRSELRAQSSHLTRYRIGNCDHSAETTAAAYPKKIWSSAMQDTSRKVTRVTVTSIGACLCRRRPLTAMGWVMALALVWPLSLITGFYRSSQLQRLEQFVCRFYARSDRPCLMWRVSWLGLVVCMAQQTLGRS